MSAAAAAVFVLFLLLLSPPVPVMVMEMEAAAAFAFALGESLLITAMFDDDDRVVVDEFVLLMKRGKNELSYPTHNRECSKGLRFASPRQDSKSK